MGLLWCVAGEAFLSRGGQHVESNKALLPALFCSVLLLVVYKGIWTVWPARLALQLAINHE